MHSDLCGKMNVKSESGAEYFLSFTDDKTCYVWIMFSIVRIRFLRNFKNGKMQWKVDGEKG